MSCTPDKPISKRPSLGGVAAKPPESSVTRKKENHAIELKTLKTANKTLQPEADVRLAKYGLEVERLSRRSTPARRDGDASSRLATRSVVAAARIVRSRASCSSASAPSNATHPKALGLPRGRWSCQRQSSSRACWRNSRRRRIWRVQVRDQRPARKNDQLSCVILTVVLCYFA